MQRLAKHLLIVLVILTVTVFAVHAGLHFVGSLSTGFGSLKANIDVSGFGSDTSSVSINLTATGSGLTAWCENKGGNRAPGQNSVSVSVSSTQDVGVNKKGRASASFHVNLTPSAAEAGCPNNKWKVTDLLGTFNVVLTATDLSSGDSVSQTYTCTVNEAQQWVTCS